MASSPELAAKIQTAIIRLAELSTDPERGSQAWLPAFKDNMQFLVDWWQGRFDRPEPATPNLSDEGEPGTAIFLCADCAHFAKDPEPMSMHVCPKCGSKNNSVRYLDGDVSLEDGKAVVIGELIEEDVRRGELLNKILMKPYSRGVNFQMVDFPPHMEYREGPKGLKV